MKRAFTLMEVNLAMLIMAGGILSIVGLYTFGFRESGQSREDVASAALADAVVSPLVMAVSATNLKWSAFRNIASFPSENGWRDYCNSSGQVTSDPESKAESVFNQLMAKCKSAAKGNLEVNTSYPSAALSGAGLSCGLVVIHEEDSPVVGIAFRATRKPGLLLAMPLYYTEVRFQGIADE